MTTWRLGPYRAVGHRFVVEGNDADDVRDRVSHALEPLVDPSPDQAGELAAYEVLDKGSSVSGRYRVRIGRRILVDTDSTAMASAFVVWHVNQAVVTADRGKHLILHAGGVQRQGVTVALPAPMESGKTTTTAGLLRAGFGYLTDEALVLDRQDLAGHSLPEGTGAGQALGRRRGCPALTSVPQRRQRWAVACAVVGPRWARGSRRCPRRRRGLPLLPGRRSDRADGRCRQERRYMLLAGSTFEFTRRPRRNLETLAALAEALPAYQLSIGDLGAAVDLVTQLVCEHRNDSDGSQRRTA